MNNTLTIPTTSKSSPPRLIIAITPEGVESPVIHADTERDQIQMEGLLMKIAPCLNIADAILQKGDQVATV